MLSLDAAEAFDNVSHIRLLHNLRKRRIPLLIIEWVKDFLTNRRIKIKLLEFISEWIRTSTDIPQGSPLSPILYLFYNTDLLEICNILSSKCTTTG